MVYFGFQTIHYEKPNHTIRLLNFVLVFRFKYPPVRAPTFRPMSERARELEVEQEWLNSILTKNFIKRNSYMYIRNL